MAALVWLVVVGFVILAQGGIPVAWKWAILGYGGCGFVECLATLSDQRAAWSRKLLIARVVAVGGFAVALVYSIVASR